MNTDSIHLETFQLLGSHLRVNRHRNNCLAETLSKLSSSSPP